MKEEIDDEKIWVLEDFYIENFEIGNSCSNELDRVCLNEIVTKCFVRYLVIGRLNKKIKSQNVSLDTQSHDNVEIYF
jgi:hypothetical protein